MENKANQRINEIRSRHSRYKLWQRVVSGLSAVTVFVTTYALILPAITQESKAFCGHEEHVHSLEEGCYQEIRTLTCGKAESEEGHLHTDACYTEREALLCSLEEAEGHFHTDDCYAEEAVLICENSEEDHEHGAECYETGRTLTCTLEESQGHSHTSECYGVERVLSCGEEETAHVHTDACYGVSYELVCEKEEHAHGLVCYSDPDADVETANVWERSFRDAELTGNWAEDVIAIAETQVGYQESENNYLVDGDEVKGYTRYGAWYGDPYGDWCAMFASFCLYYAGVDEEILPFESNSQVWVSKLAGLELYHETYNGLNESQREALLERLREEALAAQTEDELSEEELLALGEELVPALPSYEAKPGDLVFFDWDVDGYADHVGLVVELLDEEGRSVTEALRAAKAALAKAREGEDEEAILAAEAVLAAAQEMVPAKIRTVEGNSADQVRHVTYGMDDETVLGYGVLPENPDPENIGVKGEIPAAVEENVYAFTAVAENGIAVTMTAPESSLPHPAEELHLEVFVVEDEAAKALVEEAAEVATAEAEEPATEEPIVEEPIIEPIIEEPVEPAPVETEADAGIAMPAEAETTAEAVTEEKEENTEPAPAEEETEAGIAIPEEGEAAPRVQRATILFDIRLMHGDEEVEPIGPVSVSFAGIETPNDDAQIFHVDPDSETVEEMPVETDENGELIMDAAHFSIYAVTYTYTVDFHFGDYTYSIAGESSVLLSELLTKLGIELTLSEITDVIFSDEMLVKVTRQGEDWLLTSLAPFHTAEALILKLKNETQVVIIVTDALDVSTNVFSAETPEKYTYWSNEAIVFKAGVHISEETAEDVVWDIRIPKKYINNTDAVGYSKSFLGMKSVTGGVEGDEFVIRYRMRSEMGGVTTQTILDFPLKNGWIADGTTFPITSRVMDANGAVLASATVEYTVRTQAAHFRKLVSTIQPMEKITEGAGFYWRSKVPGGTEDTEHPGYLTSDLSQLRSVGFYYSLYDEGSSSVRFYSPIVITDTLPTYRDANGELQYAHFDPALNPGWTYDAASHTVSYTYENRDSFVSYTSAVSGDPDMYDQAGYGRGLLREDNSRLGLYLKFPGAKLNEEIINSAAARLTPVDQVAGEASLTQTSTARLILQPTWNNSQPTVGEKRAFIAPPDLEYYRSPEYTTDGVFGWLYYVNINAPVLDDQRVYDVEIRDFNLDDRLEFAYLQNDDSWGYWRGTIDVTGVMKDGTPVTVVTDFDVTSSSYWKIDLPSGLAEFTVKSSTPGSSYFTRAGHRSLLKVACRYIGDPSVPICINGVYEDFWNTATVSYKFDKDGETYKYENESSAYLRVWPHNPKIQLEKRASKNGSYAVGVVRPGDTLNFEWDIVLNNHDFYYEPLRNVRLVDILPPGVELDTSQFGRWYPYINWNNVGMDLEVKRFPQVDYNYKGQGVTALIWEMGDLLPERPGLGYSAGGQRAMLSIRYPVKILDHITTGTHTNIVYMYSDNGLTYFSPHPEATLQPDVWDIDNDLDTEEQMYWSSADIRAVANQQLIATKYVKGDQDLDYVATPTKGISKSDGTASYKLELYNNGGDTFTTLTLLDLLPKVGDKTATTYSSGGRQARGSEYAVTLTGPLTAPAGFTVYYTTVDPESGAYADMEAFEAASIWSTSMPDYAQATAVKIVMDDGVTLEPQQTTAFYMDVKLNNGGNSDIEAVNSFGFRTETNGSFTESNWVALMITGPYQVEGTVFKDIDRNGLYEPAVDGVYPNYLVELVNEQGQPVDIYGEVVTATNGKTPCRTTTDASGFYSMTVYQAGTYKVRVITPDGVIVTEYNAARNGNHINEVSGTTGLTSTFRLDGLYPRVIRNAGYCEDKGVVSVKKTLVDANPSSQAGKLTQAASLRVTPDASGYELAVLAQNADVTVLAKYDNWYRVSCEVNGDTKTGWLPASAVSAPATLEFFAIQVTMKDASGTAVTPPAGAGYSVSGNTATLLLANGGSLTIVGLTPGTEVTVAEPTHPGYSVSTEVDGGSRQVGESRTVTVNAHTRVTVINRDADSFQIKKVDKDTGALITGSAATFVLQNSAGQYYTTSGGWTQNVTDSGVLKISTTPGTGVALLPELPEGDYFLKEVTPPSGYVSADDTLGFRVDQSGNIILQKKNIDTNAVMTLKSTGSLTDDDRRNPWQWNYGQYTNVMTSTARWTDIHTGQFELIHTFGNSNARWNPAYLRTEIPEYVNITDVSVYYALGQYSGRSAADMNDFVATRSVFSSARWQRVDDALYVAFYTNGASWRNSIFTVQVVIQATMSDTGGEWKNVIGATRGYYDWDGNWETDLTGDILTDYDAYAASRYRNYYYNWGNSPTNTPKLASPNPETPYDPWVGIVFENERRTSFDVTVRKTVTDASAAAQTAKLANAANLYPTPSASGTPVAANIAAETSVTLLAKNSAGTPSWYRVSCSAGTGWVLASSVKEIPADMRFFPIEVSVVDSANAAIDLTGKSIPGASIGTGADSNKVTAWLANGGSFVIPDLPEGAKLTVKETDATGYTVTYADTGLTGGATANEAYTATVGTADGTVTVTNTPNSPITIKKVDAAGNLITTGATFKVRCDFGENNGKWLEVNQTTGQIEWKSGNPEQVGTPYTTGADGTVELPALPAGDYTLKETGIPDGFRPVGGVDETSFTVNANGKVAGATTVTWPAATAGERIYVQGAATGDATINIAGVEITGYGSYDEACAEDDDTFTATWVDDLPGGKLHIRLSDSETWSDRDSPFIMFLMADGVSIDPASVQLSGTVTTPDGVPGLSAGDPVSKITTWSLEDVDLGDGKYHQALIAYLDYNGGCSGYGPKYTRIFDFDVVLEDGLVLDPAEWTEAFTLLARDDYVDPAERIPWPQAYRTPAAAYDAYVNRTRCGYNGPGDKIDSRLTISLQPEAVSTATETDTVTVVNEPIAGPVIWKLDSADQTPITSADAQFILTNGADSYMLNSDPQGRIQLPAGLHGTYTLTEIAAPAGYTLPDPASRSHTLVINNGVLETLDGKGANYASGSGSASGGYSYESGVVDVIWHSDPWPGLFSYDDTIGLWRNYSAEDGYPMKVGVTETAQEGVFHLTCDFGQVIQREQPALLVMLADGVELVDGTLSSEFTDPHSCYTYQLETATVEGRDAIFWYLTSVNQQLGSWDYNLHIEADVRLSDPSVLEGGSWIDIAESFVALTSDDDFPSAWNSSVYASEGAQDAAGFYAAYLSGRVFEEPFPISHPYTLQLRRLGSAPTNDSFAIENTKETPPTPVDVTVKKTVADAKPADQQGKVTAATLLREKPESAANGVANGSVAVNDSLTLLRRYVDGNNATWYYAQSGTAEGWILGSCVDAGATRFFKLEATVTNGSGSPIDLTGKSIPGATIGTGADSNKVTAELANGGSFVIPALPEGAQVDVRELNPDGYTVQINKTSGTTWPAYTPGDSISGYPFDSDLAPIPGLMVVSDDAAMQHEDDSFTADWVAPGKRIHVRLEETFDYNQSYPCLMLLMTDGVSIDESTVQVSGWIDHAGSEYSLQAGDPVSDMTTCFVEDVALGGGLYHQALMAYVDFPVNTSSTYAEYKDSWVQECTRVLEFDVVLEDGIVLDPENWKTAFTLLEFSAWIDALRTRPWPIAYRTIQAAYDAYQNNTRILVDQYWYEAKGLELPAVGDTFSRYRMDFQLKPEAVSGPTIEVVNTPVPKIIVHKTDLEGNDLKDAVFAVRCDFGENQGRWLYEDPATGQLQWKNGQPDVVGTPYRTGADGKVTLPGLAPGDYTLKEIDPPGGYRPVGGVDETPFTVNDNGKVVGGSTSSGNAETRMLGEMWGCDFNPPSAWPPFGGEAFPNGSAFTVFSGNPVSMRDAVNNAGYDEAYFQALGANGHAYIWEDEYEFRRYALCVEPTAQPDVYHMDVFLLMTRPWYMPAALVRLADGVELVEGTPRQNGVVQYQEERHKTPLGTWGCEVVDISEHFRLDQDVAAGNDALYFHVLMNPFSPDHLPQWIGHSDPAFVEYALIEVDYYCFCHIQADLRLSDSFTLNGTDWTDLFSFYVVENDDAEGAYGVWTDTHADWTDGSRDANGVYQHYLDGTPYNQYDYSEWNVNCKANVQLKATATETDTVTIENEPDDFSLTVVKSVLGEGPAKQAGTVKAGGATLYEAPAVTAQQAATAAEGAALTLLRKHNDGTADWYQATDGTATGWVPAAQVETDANFFPFEVTVMEEDGATAATLDAIPGATVEGNKVTFWLANNGSITLTHLPKNSKATIKETSHDGYQVLIKEGNANLANGNTSPALTMNQSRTITVVNNPGIELPQTGGPGTHFWSYGGLALMALAVGMIVVPRRRRTGKEVND